MLEYWWNFVLNGGGSKVPNPPIASELISETLLEELHGCLKEIETLQQEKEAKRKKEAGRPDYSWLVNDSVKHYRLPRSVKVEVEDLCTQIDADVAPLVIKDFRRIITEDTPVEKIPEVFRCVLKRQLMVKNLKTESDNRREIRRASKSNKSANSIFRRRLDVPGLSNRDIEAWGSTSEGRVQSAPASSWRFFRQVKVKPTEKPSNPMDDVECISDKDARRANSVPTITTIV